MMNPATAKLFLVRLKGFKLYVVATDPNEAIAIAQGDLDARNYGLSDSRRLVSVELLAEDSLYPSTEMRLYAKRAEQSHRS